MSTRNFNGAIRDSAFMAITETMGITADAHDANDPEVLLTITLSGNSQTAVLGGTLDADKIQQLEDLLGELKRRAPAEGDGDRVLHVWR